MPDHARPLSEPGASTTAPHVETDLVYAHGLAALITLLVSVVFGIVVSIQLLVPDLGASVSWLGWGRLRYAHTQGIMLGWLGNAFLAFLYHAVPILTGRRVTSRRLGLWLCGLWNLVVMAPGWVLVLAGISQPLEWAEFPPIIDVFVVVGLVLAAVQFLPPFFKGGLDDLYVSSWYVIGALVFTLLAYPMGNLVPVLVPGAQGAAFSGLWIHDAVGLFVTPLALAILYFVIPAVSGRPIFSHFLSMLGFWLLFFIYPLNGTHHYVYSVIPMAAQLGAIAASTVLGLDVVIVVTNLLLSLRGSGVFTRDVGLRFVAMSTIFYLVVSLQGSLQAQMAVNQAVHFSDWVIGHSHLAMLGFATFAAAGGLVHAWQRIPGVRYNARALDWAYWLLFGGVIVMVSDLTLAGIIQGRLWSADTPWLDAVRASQPFWLVRTLSAVPIAAGFLALLAGLTTGPRDAGRRAIEAGGGGDDAVKTVMPVLSTAPSEVP
ncbi:MAG: cbb3-type cytochrome c oxidase subunit I [Acidobacteriota bacterium]